MAVAARRLLSRLGYISTVYESPGELLNALRTDPGAVRRDRHRLQHARHVRSRCRPRSRPAARGPAGRPHLGLLGPQRGRRAGRRGSTSGWTSHSRRRSSTACCAGRCRSADAAPGRPAALASARRRKTAGDRVGQAVDVGGLVVDLRGDARPQAAAPRVQLNLDSVLDEQRQPQPAGIRVGRSGGARAAAPSPSRRSSPAASGASCPSDRSDRAPASHASPCM